MALVVGTNSWITVTEADTYFGDRIGVDSWDGLTDSDKSKYLVTAYNWIKNYPGVSVPASSTDTLVKQAQAEAALFLVDFYEDLRTRDGLYTAGVRSFTKSKWREELEKQTLPPSVENPLEDGGFFTGGAAALVNLSDSSTCY